MNNLEMTRYSPQSDKLLEDTAERVALYRQLDAAPNGTIVDISNVVYISLEGLNILVMAQRHAQKSGKTLAITGIHNDHVRNTFMATRMNRFLEIYETPEKAEEAIARRDRNL